MNPQSKAGIDYIGVSVVFFCHDGDGRFLLGKRHDDCRDERGRWCPGAGQLEVHEAAEDAVGREAREEYKAIVKDISVLGVRDVHRKEEGRSTHWVAIDHLVLIDPDGVGIGEPNKQADVRWFVGEDLRFLAESGQLHSQFPYFMSKYRAQIYREARIQIPPADPWGPTDVFAQGA